MNIAYNNGKINGLKLNLYLRNSSGRCRLCLLLSFVGGLVRHRHEVVILWPENNIQNYRKRCGSKNFFLFWIFWWQNYEKVENILSTIWSDRQKRRGQTAGGTVWTCKLRLVFVSVERQKMIDTNETFLNLIGRLKIWVIVRLAGFFATANGCAERIDERQKLPQRIPWIRIPREIPN